MTVSNTIDHAPSTTESVLVAAAPKSEMTLQSVVSDPKTGEIAATYVLASGDFRYPATVVFRSAIQTRATGSKRRISMTYSTWATSTDSISLSETKREISTSVSMLIPADTTLELDDLDVLLSTAYSFMYAQVTSGVRNTAWLQKLVFGLPEVS